VMDSELMTSSFIQQRYEDSALVIFRQQQRDWSAAKPEASRLADRGEGSAVAANQQAAGTKGESIEKTEKEAKAKSSVCIVL